MTFTSKCLRTLAGLLVVLAASQVRPASAQNVEQQVAAWVGSCLACHPLTNVPGNSVNPIIWGQNEGYVYVQLRDFKRAARASESDATMHALTQAMTDAQMLAIARNVSARPWPQAKDGATPATDPLFRSGAQLVAYGDCGACHFNDWKGYSATPRLSGQTPAYLTTTINELRSGKRGNSPGMSDLLRVYSADDIKAIIAYLSSVD